MTYQTVLVNLNDAARAPMLLEVSKSLARRAGSHLIGLYVVPAIEYVPTAVGIDIPPSILDEKRKYFEAQARETEQLFEKGTQGEDFSSEWRCEDAYGAQIAGRVVEHARYADISVVSQEDPDNPVTGLTSLAERLIMEGGRPVLMVPHSGNFSDIGAYPVVAWNASRESTRAIHDALPILESAKDVKIVWVNPNVNADQSEEILGSEIATSLARHGVNVDASHVVASNVDVGDMLLNRVSDMGADLLVMGGYGRSRLREYVFGGATHHILRHMTVPVLMSH